MIKSLWAQVKPYLWAIKLALVLGACLTIYIKGRADGAHACEKKAEKQHTEALEKEIKRATKKAAQDAAQARQDAEVAQEAARIRQEQAIAAEGRARRLEALLGKQPDCRLTDDALDVLRESMK